MTLYPSSSENSRTAVERVFASLGLSLYRLASSTHFAFKVSSSGIVPSPKFSGTASLTSTVLLTIFSMETGAFIAEIVRLLGASLFFGFSSEAGSAFGSSGSMTGATAFGASIFGSGTSTFGVSTGASTFGASTLGASEATFGGIGEALGVTAPPERNDNFIKAYSICRRGLTLNLYPDSHCVVTVRASKRNWREHFSACSLYLFFKESGNSNRASVPPLLLTIRSLKCELNAATKCRALNPFESLSSNLSKAVT